MKTFVSDLSGKRYPIDDRIAGEAVRSSLRDLIQKDYPDFDVTKHLSLDELNIYREKYISNYLLKEVGQISKLDNKVLASINSKKVIAADLDDDGKSTFGQKVADKVASFGGSWRFIIIFVSILLLWIILNSLWIANRAFDPYPFILLNLVLSFLAALQAPVIMMSQNRQSNKDRVRSKNDYMINLKSELEIRGLHEKIDHLMLHQQQELIEIQRIQIEMLSDIQKRIKMDKKETKSVVRNTKKIEPKD